MAVENRNYTNVSTVIQNAITAFNNIESTLSAMGAKTTSNGDINSTQYYLSAADLRSIIQSQLQLKASGIKTITSKSSNDGLITGTYTSNAGWIVQDATIGTATLSTSENTILSDGNGISHENASDGSRYYTLTLSDLVTTIPTTTAGWYAGGTVTAPLTFNIGAATFTFNAASGTVTCTSPGYVAQSNSTIVPVTSAHLTASSSVSSLTGTPLEATDPAAADLANYYAITATPTDVLSGFSAGIFTNINEITRVAGTSTTKYIKKGLITSGATESSNTFTLTPGQSATISTGYYATGKTVNVSTVGADVTADYMILGKKGWGANNTLITGNIQPYDSTYTINLNNQTDAITYSNGTVTVNGAIVNAGYYNGSKISGTITVPAGSVTINTPSVNVTSGGSAASILETSNPGGSTYKLAISPSATTVAGIIGSGTVSAASDTEYWLPKRGASNISLTSGTGLTPGAGNISVTSGYDDDVFSTSTISGGYSITLKGSGTVSREDIKISGDAGYYPAFTNQLKSSGTSATSNEASQTVYIKKGAVTANLANFPKPTITAVAGDFTGSTQNSSHSTLNISTTQPASGVYYKLTASSTATPGYSTSTSGYIKSDEFAVASAQTKTETYYIPQAKFRYNNTANAANRFIECMSAGYYPTGALNIVDDGSISTDDLDYASVLASVSTGSINIISSGSSVPTGAYEISISKDSSTDPGYISGTEGQGNISLNTHYYIEKGSVSSAIKTISSSVSSADVTLVSASNKVSGKTYYAITPSASATTEMIFTSGYIASKGSEGSTSNQTGTAAYVKAAEYSFEGGALTAGSGTATFNTTKLMTGTTESTPETDILLSSTTGLTNYYKINISGKGVVNKSAAKFSVTEGYTSGFNNITVAAADSAFSSNTATATKYIPQSSLTNNTSLASGASATAVTYGSYAKISAGYYPTDRYIQSTADSASVNPTVGAITVTQTSPGSSTVTLTATIDGIMNVNVGTAGYLDSANNIGTITPKNLSEFNNNSVTLVVKKGSLSAGAISMTANSTSPSNRGIAKFTTTDPGSSASYVKVAATRTALSVGTGYLTNSERTTELASDKTVTAYIDAVASPSITGSANAVNGSGTIGSVSTFSDSTGAVTAGDKSGTIGVSGNISGTGSFKDKYMLANVSVSGTASGSASASIHADASGTNVDNAIEQLYKCILGKSYVEV